jgi:hypothetical protein
MCIGIVETLSLSIDKLNKSSYIYEYNIIDIWKDFITK